MSQQSTLTNFFKTKALPVQLKSSKSSDKNTKMSSLTLKKPCTHSKSPKTPSKDVVPVVPPRKEMEDDVVSLSSDSDFEETPSKKKRNTRISVRSIESLTSPGHMQSPNSSASNSSVTTIVYNLSPGAALWQSPNTPTKSLKSPGSSNEFYSPTKKRVLNKKSPAKRNLANKFNENVQAEVNNIKDNFSPKVEYPDDKTTFLLSIIDKCLKTETLKRLLEEDSQVLLEKCLQVVEPGMTLMCRLYWRQHNWYRMEDLGLVASRKKKQMSSPDLFKMVTSLQDYGLITSAGTGGEAELDFDDYIKLLKKPDLVQICKDLKLKIQSKQDAADALRNFSKLAPISNFYTVKKVNNNRTRVLDILKSKTGPCYKISDLALTTFHNLYVLMYLGIDYTIIRDKKLELMLLHEKINRETYPVDKNMVVDDASVVFQDREEFYRYLQAHTIYENYLRKVTPNEKCEIIEQSYNLYKGLEEEHMLRYKSFPPWLRRFTPPNIYIKILEDGVQELKKLKTEKYFKLAIDILRTLIDQIGFRQHKKSEWYAEKALILHNHLDSSEKAAKILIEGFKSDMSEENKDAMRPRAKKIANQQNIDLKEELREELRNYATKEAMLESNLPSEHIYKQPKDNYNQRGKLKFEVHTQETRTTLSAEDYCILHYVSRGQYINGEHWEGRIVSTIFFLLFWDIIYSKPRGVTGIFMSHYQRYPLDMFSESFYVNRKTLIDERLKFIKQCSEEQLLKIMESKWEERPESEISEIQRSIGWDAVREVTSCVRARGVAVLCRRLLTNYGYARSGFPDLTLWNVHTKKIKFVEVKTDADKPSVKQLQWLRYLIEHDIDAGFCYVGVNTTRSRARSLASSSD